VKLWKAILATLVIFAAGMFAGGMVAKKIIPQKPLPMPAPPVDMQQRFYQKLKRELELTADQTNRLDKIFVEGNARVKIIWDLMAPELQKERQEVYENIRAALTPEQREKFERLIKERSPRKPDSDGSRRGPKPGETNRTKEPRPEEPPKQ
jgi:Spy/CpxP family protein refolding chaperone